MQNMTASEARATAAKEGLELQTGGGGSGFVGVYQTSKTCKLPFVAQVQRGRKHASLGFF